MNQEQDTPLPMGRFNVAPFGETGIINNNNLTTVGQGLKKIFNPQIDIPRQFEPNIPMMANKRGANSGVAGSVQNE